MSQQVYNWKRFWCPRSSQVDLGDRGFLTNPESDWGKHVNPNLVALEVIANIPCLVLLGEPGIGKSQEMDNLKKYTEANHEVLALDLRSCTNLKDDLFRDEQFTAWKGGTHCLYLFLDSLDEGLLQIQNLATQLVDGFKKNEYRDKFDRLYIRIACRTAIFPNILEDGLESFWKKENVGIYELAPLRRIDVNTAVNAYGLNADAFLDEVDYKGVVPFAIKPLTLKFLIKKFQDNNGQFPAQLKLEDLYLEGCRWLCEEQSLSRRASRQVGELLVEQRLIVAARIAAITVFANRFAVWTDNSGNTPGEDVFIESLCSGDETANGSRFSVNSREGIEEVLDTGLFASCGANRIGWAHQTYAEFLAAWYLRQHSLCISQILVLIIHPDQRLIPQLQETAAWLADMMPEVFQEVMKTDPDILLQSDLENKSDDQKKALVTSLLKAHSDRILPRKYNFRRYTKLSHSTLAKQLHPYVCGHIGNENAQRVAIDIAGACRLKELQNDLVNVALNPQEQYWTRVSAAISVCQIGDAITKAKLMPLALSQAGDDPEDELKGCGLRAIWPEHISVTELLNLLTRPKSELIGGRYQSFIVNDISKHLQVEDLPVALNWVKQQLTIQALRYPFEHLSDQILFKAWENFDYKEIPEKFTACAIFRLKERHEVFDLYDQGSFSSALSENNTKRLRFIEKVVSSIPHTETKFFWLLNVHPDKHIISQDDVFWMIEQLESASDEWTQHVWSELIYHCVNWLSCDHVSKILIASEGNSILRSKFIQLIEPVEIDSEKAKQCIAKYRETQQIEKENSLTLLETHPNRRVLECLDKFESGDLNAWITLYDEMKLTPTGDDGDYSSPDLTQLPGWQDANEMTRNRIISASEIYIENGNPNTALWLGTNSIFCDALSGYEALYLQVTQRLDSINRFKDEIWKKWASTILTYHDYYITDYEYNKNRDILIQKAYYFAPNEILTALTVEIDQQCKKGKWINIHSKLSCCWDERLSKVLLQKINEPNLDSQNLEALLGFLLGKKIKQAQDLAESLIFLLISQSSKDCPRIVAVARSLIFYAENAGWPVVWPIIQSEPEISREITGFMLSAFEDYELGQRLNEDQIAELYIYLTHNYFELEASDSNNLQDYLSYCILATLQERGTSEACEALRKIICEFPELADGLRWYLLEAEATVRLNTWNPPEPEHILQLVLNQDKRLVQDEHQLLKVLLESLDRLELELQGETPAVRDLWDKCNDNFFRPIDENAFSDYVKRFLDRDLKSRGIIVNREVELRRGSGGKSGERTDIHIDAVLKHPSGQTYSSITVIVEVKGCWHSEVQTAMESQLVGRYLSDNACRHGLYLIGWFSCQQWDSQDSRKNKTPRMTLDEARIQFDSQAETLSSSETEVCSYVLNTALR
jgi:predicted NACHT family NTPase